MAQQGKRFAMMRPLALLTCAFGLAACDAAMEQFDGQVRQAAVEQCQQVAENTGVAADLVRPVCECTAGKLLEGGAANVSQIDQARIEEVLNGCLAKTSPADARQVAPEQTNG
jgi:hypothetical protein